MDSKESNSTPTLTILMISEDLEQINEFDEKNYQNRKYKFENLEQGKKFFKLRYIKDKIKIAMNKKSSDITVNKKLIPQLDDKEKEKLFNYENLLLNHNKTRQNYIQKYSRMFLILLEKSIFFFNSEKWQESYDILFNFDIIKNEAEFGEILLVISGYDKKLIGELFKNKDKTEIIKGFLKGIEMSHFTSLIECYKFIYSRAPIFFQDETKNFILNTFAEIYYEDNKNNEKIINMFKNQINIGIYLNAIVTVRNSIYNQQSIKIQKDDFATLISFMPADQIDKLYKELHTDFEISNDYLSELYTKLSILLEKNKSEFENNENINELGEEQKKEFLNYLEKKEIIEEEILNKKINNLDIIKTNFTTLTHLTFGKKEQETLSVPIKFSRITGSSTALKEYLVVENFTKIVYEKNITSKTKVKHGNSISIEDIIDIRLGITTGENFKKYFKSFPNEEKTPNNFISIICQKEQIDLKINEYEQGLKWFKALKSLLILFLKNKEKKNENEKKIKEDVTLIWKNYIVPKWSLYGNYFLFKKLDRANYLKEINFNPEGKKQYPTIKYDILEDKKNPLIKSINYFLKEAKDKLKKKDNILEFNEFMVLCELGIADSAREKIWPILIGNKCGITSSIYKSLKESINKIDNFDNLESEYFKNVNIAFLQNNYINQMIKDIIRYKYIFLQEIISKKISPNEIMSSVYNISRAFFLHRFDIPYNKNIITLIYLFLLKKIPEENTFICIYNLICTNSALSKLYLWKKKYIKIHEIFSEKFEEYLPKLYLHFEKMGIVCNLYLFDWIESLFTLILDSKISSLIIDLYLIYGEHILIQTSITILGLLEEKLVNMNGEEILKELESNHEDKFQIYQFFDCFKNYMGIKNDYIKHRINNEFGFQKTDLLEILMNN